jgi:excisionase family DNA binding protein
MTITPPTGGEGPPFQSPYFDTDEAALYLRIERRTLENLRWRGEGPRYRKHGGRVRYHVADLDSWSESRGRTEP